MTELLEKAIAKVQKLPAAEQDESAAMLLSLLEDGVVALDDDTRAAVREGLAQAERGEFASDEEIAAVFGRRDEHLSPAGRGRLRRAQHGEDG